MPGGRTLLALSAQLAMLLAWQPNISAQICAGPPTDLGASGYWGETHDDGVWPTFEPIDGCYITRPKARFGTAVFDVLLLNRSDPGFAGLVRDQGSGTFALDTTQMELSTSAGFRFQWTCQSECGTDLQFSFMGSHGFGRTRGTTGTDVRGVLFDSISATPATSVTTNYSSILDSGELNLRTRDHKNIAAIVGLRVLQMEDAIVHLSTAGTGDAKADNELYGIQFGFEAAAFRYGPWTLEGSVKAGVYYNNLDVMVSWSNINWNRRFHQTSFVGDVNLLLRYQLTPRLSMRVGYQAVFLDGVALLPDQYDKFNVFSTPVQGRADLSTVQYHGALIGLEATW